MTNIVNKSAIKRIGINYQLSDTGSESKLYILNDGSKYKEFASYYNDLGDEVNYGFYEDLVSKTQLESSTFLFPRKVVASKRKLYGVIEDYANGVVLNGVSPSIKLKILLRLIEKIEDEILLITSQACLIDDLHEDNIIVDENNLTIKVIDTDFYRVDKSLSEVELLKKNLRSLFGGIFYSLFPNYFLSKISDRKSVSFNYLCGTLGNLKLSTFIYLLLDELHINIDDDLSLSDVRKMI